VPARRDRRRGRPSMRRPPEAAGGRAVSCCPCR
jgi:hypothetical protein